MTSKIAGKRLTEKELEVLIKAIRFWVQPHKNVGAKLINNIRHLENEIKNLRTELHRIKQLDLNHSDKPLEPPRVVSKVDWTHLKVDPNNRYPLPKRLRILYENNKRGTDEWIRTLRWNQLTEDQAFEMIKAEQEKTI